MNGLEYILYFVCLFVPATILGQSVLVSIFAKHVTFWERMMSVFCSICILALLTAVYLMYREYGETNRRDLEYSVISLLISGIVAIAFPWLVFLRKPKRIIS